MRYFRYYPWGLQLLLFMLMVFTMISGAGVVIASVFTKMTGFDPTRMQNISPDSPAGLVSAALTLQGISSICIFLLPALLFAYLTTPRPAEYLGLRAPKKNIHLLLVVLIMLGATPVFELIQWLVSNINFGAKIKAEQQASDNMYNAFLSMPTPGSFIKAFSIMALIPAIGEEMFFRGVLMRFARQRSRNMVFPVVFTALIFAYSHSNIYGYIPIFLAGLLLALMYNLTGSIWCSILAHLSFNGVQVALSYLSNHNKNAKAFLDSNSILAILVAAGAIVFGLSFYMLLKTKTPLPDNWSDNFTPEELSQNAE